MYEVKYTTQFKRDYKMASKHGLPMIMLKDVIVQLATGETLPPKYHDHQLAGNYIGYRECHIQPDWLLVYRIEKGILTLVLNRHTQRAVQ